mmetsp:Transcript_73601/g.204546  ORF Transcript_73601/g.204546 Transcript_73601/m.204546 type:complete len:424 (+) Transcript_73601:220-1491(+)
MDYFAVGGRPLLSLFPPHILTTRLSFDQEQGKEVHCAEQPSYASPGDVDAGGNVAEGGYPPQNVQTAETRATPAMPSGYPTWEPAPSGPLYTTPPERTLALHEFFDQSEVKPWEKKNFEMVRKLQDATRNRGHVHLMRDLTSDRLVAVKQMPNRWVRNSHTDFVAEHPGETELPWQDIGCIKFLNSQGYDYGCALLGVYRDEEDTYVVTSFASEGDLFSWCEVGVSPGPEREVIVYPLARQIMLGVQQLHECTISHRDLSLENILLTKGENSSDPDALTIRIIDFSMASTARVFRSCVRGKASYQAPELHTDQDYDGYLSDVFSLGVTLYALLLKDYPWLSTRPGGCKCFEYVRKHGFRSYLAKRKLRNSNARVGEFISEPLKQLLEGLLAFDPADRLTLGESSWGDCRRSIWDEPWMHSGPQ